MSGIRDDVPSSHHDLLERPLTGGLTTVDGQGRPQSTGIWFLLDEDGEFKSSTTADRQKYRNLVRNPECSFLIIDPENPYRTLEIRGQAELTPDPGDVVTARFADHYGWPLEQLAASADRYTITYRVRRVIANPPSQG